MSLLLDMPAPCVIDAPATAKPKRRRTRWRNLYFIKTGGTEWGFSVWPSRLMSEAASRQFFDDLAAYTVGGSGLDDLVETSSGSLIPCGDFTFALALPWHGAGRVPRRSEWP